MGKVEEQILIFILRLLICFQIKMLTMAIALPFEKSIEAGKVLTGPQGALLKKATVYFRALFQLSELTGH